MSNFLLLKEEWNHRYKWMKGTCSEHPGLGFPGAWGLVSRAPLISISTPLSVCTSLTSARPIRQGHGYKDPWYPFFLEGFLICLHSALGLLLKWEVLDQEHPEVSGQQLCIPQTGHQGSTDVLLCFLLVRLLLMSLHTFLLLPSHPPPCLSPLPPPPQTSWYAWLKQSQWLLEGGTSSRL